MPQTPEQLVQRAEDEFGGEWNGEEYHYQNLAGERKTTTREVLLVVGEALQLERLKTAIGMEIVDEVIAEEKRNG